MEKINLSEIYIIDSEFYNKNGSYVKTFKKNNIITLEQLFNDKLMGDLMEHCQQRTRIQIKGLIALMKYKYLGIPLYNDILLDKRIEFLFENISGVTETVGYREENGKCHVLVLEEMGFDKHQSTAIKSRIISILNNSEGKRVTLIECFKQLVPKEKIKKPYHGTVIPIIQTYIESYEKKNSQEILSPRSKQLLPQTLTQETIDSLEYYQKIIELRKQISDLISIRDNLDTQIASLQERLDILSENRNPNKGGIKKWAKYK
jgi:hypothetical protein